MRGTWLLPLSLALACHRAAAPATPVALPQPATAPVRSPSRVVSGVPDALVVATDLLQELGLADPRGLEYREVAVSVGAAWVGDDGVLTIHAWTSPAGPQQAVAWNGLVYPVVRLGPAQDLAADVAACVQADARARAQRPGFGRHEPAATEADSMSHTVLLPIKAAMLLRLGEDELVRTVWTAWSAGIDPRDVNSRMHLEDPVGPHAVPSRPPGLTRIAAPDARGG